MKSNSFLISVSEPWDFESQDGQNVISGQVLTTVNKRCVIFKSNYILEFEGFKGYFLVLTPRHKGNDFSDLGKDLVVVNGNLLLNKYEKSFSEHDLINNSKFVLIGSIK